MSRLRTRCAVLLVAVIAAGLASRRYPAVLPAVLQKRTGDALWATAAFVAIGLVRPAWSTPRLTAVALAVACADEFSQAIHTPSLDRFRSHALPHLLLGSGFHWLDLPAYAVGVAVAVFTDLWWLRRRRRVLHVSACFPSDAN